MSADAAGEVAEWPIVQHWKSIGTDAKAPLKQADFALPGSPGPALKSPEKLAFVRRAGVVYTRDNAAAVRHPRAQLAVETDDPERPVPAQD
jgi:hypothetical protein